MNAKHILMFELSAVTLAALSFIKLEVYIKLPGELGQTSKYARVFDAENYLELVFLQYNTLLFNRKVVSFEHKLVILKRDFKFSEESQRKKTRKTN